MATAPSTPLSQMDSLLAVVGASVLAHLVFKRFETHEPIYLVGLLLAAPATLAPLLIPYSTSIFSAIFKVLLTYWASLLTSIVIYRVSPWHPLAQYPGPFLCKISKFYFAFLSLGGKQHEKYNELHQKYGDIVRVGPNEVSICNVNAVTPLMGPTGCAKGPFWDGRIPEQDPIRPLISIRDKAEHARRRRAWTRAFSTSALKGYEPIVTSRCIQCVDFLALRQGPVDLTDFISFFAFDVINDLAFGGGSEMMRDGDFTGLWHLLEVGQKNAIFMSHVPWLGALFLRFPYLAKDLKVFYAYAEQCGISRRTLGSSHKDIFYHLIDEDGVSTEPPSVLEVISDAGLSIIAGSGTTSSAIVNLFYFLMCHPVAYKRLQAEIDGLGGNIQNCAQQANLPYLNGAINESLRLVPPVLSGSQRAPELGTGGKLIGTFVIPEGTSAFIPHYSLHRDPRYFSPLADSFLPERWLSAEEQLALEPTIFKNRDQFILDTNAFIPFSIGPENCVGKNLAWMEMRMLVCLMVQRFDFRFADGYDPKQWSADMMDYLVTFKGKLPTVLTSRKSR